MTVRLRHITILFFACLILTISACKKEKGEDPPGVVSYKVKIFYGVETYINYVYDPLSGFLRRVHGVDRGKSINCDIRYEGNKIFAVYDNYTAAEKYNIEMDVNPSNGFITKYKDELFEIVFNYDSLSGDKRGNLLSSVIVGGRWAGDTLFKNPVYDENGLLLQCDIYRVATEYKRKMAFSYYFDQKYEAVINSNFIDMALGRFDRIFHFLPYTFGPPQNYLVKRETIVNYTQTDFNYVKDESGRVKYMYINGATHEVFYND